MLNVLLSVNFSIVLIDHAYICFLSFRNYSGLSSSDCILCEIGFQYFILVVILRHGMLSN